MGRNSGNKDLSDLNKGAVLNLKENTNLFNRQIAARENCNERTVRDVQRVASDAEKENRDPMSPSTYNKDLVPDGLVYSVSGMHDV